MSTYHTKTFGLTGYILTYLVPTKSSAWQQILGTLMTQDRRDLELSLTLSSNKFAIITETKKTKRFLALRKQTSGTDKINFSIENLIDKTNKKEDIYFDINDKLSDFNNDFNQFEPRIRCASESNSSRETINIKRQKQQQRQREQSTKNKGQVSKKPQFLSE